MAEDIPHGPPVTADLYARHGRDNPNVTIKKEGVFPLLAPTEGFVEKILKNKDNTVDTVIFRHKKEPYYSMLSNADNMVITLEIGQEVLRGVLMGTADNKVFWRVGAMGNHNDWMDPDEWLKGNYLIWGQAKDKNLGPKFKKKTDWGTIALYVGGAYLLLKGTGKAK